MRALSLCHGIHAQGYGCNEVAKHRHRLSAHPSCMVTVQANFARILYEKNQNMHMLSAVLKKEYLRQCPSITALCNCKRLASTWYNSIQLRLLRDFFPIQFICLDGTYNLSNSCDHDTRQLANWYLICTWTTLKSLFLHRPCSWH